MARPAQDVTEAELALLRALWDHGPGTVRHLAERVYGQASAGSAATVQKLLERLEAKGAVARDREPAAHVFSAAIDREALIGRRLRAVAETLCDGSVTPLLTHLLRSEGLSRRDLDHLRALIDQADGKPGRR